MSLDKVFLSEKIISLISITHVVSALCHNSCIVMENKCMIRLGWGAESAWVLFTFYSFMCKFQTHMYNIIQSELGHLTFPNREGNYFGCNILLPNDTGSFFSPTPLNFPQFTSSLLKTLYLVMALGLRLFCFSFLKWDEVFLCFCHTLPFFLIFIWASFYLNTC